MGNYECIICGNVYSSARIAYRHLKAVHHVPNELTKRYVVKINQFDPIDEDEDLDDIEVELEW